MNNDSMSSASILVFNNDSMENNKNSAYGSKDEEDDEGEHYNDGEEIDVFTSTTTTTTISSLYIPTTATPPPSVGSFTETNYLKKIKHNPRCQTDVLSQLLPQNNNNNHLNSLQNKLFYGIDVKDYKLNSLGLPYNDLHALSIDSQTTKNIQIHNQQLQQPQQHKSMKKYVDNHRYDRIKNDFIRINNNPFNDQRSKYQKPIEIQQNALKDQDVQTTFGENLKRKYQPFFVSRKCFKI